MKPNEFNLGCQSEIVYCLGLGDVSQDFKFLFWHGPGPYLDANKIPAILDLQLSCFSTILVLALPLHDLVFNPVKYQAV